MRQVTLRIPEAGHERLLKLCRTHGVSRQALFEAATIIALEDELDPDHTEVQVAIWAMAARLERSGAMWGGSERRRLAIVMDDDIFARLTEACRRFGVCYNAALGLVVMPPSAEDWEVAERYRVENLHRIIERARMIDFQRRSRSRALTDDPVTP